MPAAPARKAKMMAKPARGAAKKNRTWERRAEARPDEILDAALDEVRKGEFASEAEVVAVFTRHGL